MLGTFSSSSVMPEDSMYLLMSSQASLPSGVTKYILRPPPWTCPTTLDFDENTLPSSSSLFTRIEAWEREIPRASAIPIWVISRGASILTVGDTCLYL